MSDSTTKECVINGVQFQCRTCFDPGSQIFSITDKYNSTKTWLQLLNDIAQLKINNEELLPKTICCKCVEKLSSYYNFQLQIENVNNKYSEMLTSLSNTIQENMPPHFECLAESANVLPLVTEIKLEDECVIPFDIALESSNFGSLPAMNKERNELENEEACDPFEKLEVNLENQQSDRYLDEDTENEYTRALNENSSSSSEYLPEKNRKKDESCKNTSSPRKGKKSIWGRFQCNTCKRFCSSLSALRHHVRTLHSSLTSSSEGEEDLLPISESFEKNTVKRYPEWFKFEKIGKRFICPLCAKSFAQHRNCRRHVITVHCRKKNLFPCGFCEYNGSCKTYLYAHIRRKHPEETFDANTKRIIFRFGDRIYNKPAPWRLAECKLCNTTFFKTRELRQHLPSHCDTGTLDSLQLNSSIIQRWFSKMDLTSAKEIISRHIREKEWTRYYTVLNKFSYEVSISDTEVEELAEKLAERLKKYSCELCGKDVTFKYQLFSHMKKEHLNDEIPFKCRRCKLEFVSLDMYEQHRQTHCRNEYKTFQCSYCPGKFVYEDHMRSHHCITQVPSSGSDSEKVVLSEYLKDVEASLDAAINMENFDESPTNSRKPDQFKTLINSTSLSSKLEQNHSTKLDVKVQNQDQTTSQEAPVTPIREKHINVVVGSENNEQLFETMVLKEDNLASFSSIQPLSHNIIRCGFCIFSSKKLRDLRRHMPLHADGKTMIDFNNCYYVKEFESSKIIDHEELQQQIRNAYIKRQISRFYRAIDRYGNEMDISDSDSDEEDEAINSYMCELCKQPYTKRKLLLQHQHQCHNEDSMPFTCQDCKLQYVSFHLLQQHLKRDCWNEHRRIAEQCNYCKARFIWPHNMIKHREIQHRVMTGQLNIKDNLPSGTALTVQYCYLCPKSFFSTADVNDHLSQHRMKPSAITTIKSLAHSTWWPNGKKVINCKICHLQFTSMAKLKEHFSPNNPPSKCTGQQSFGNYSITNERGFELHLELDSETESESDTKPERDENLTNLQLYECQMCKKSFKRKYQFAQHQRSAHPYKLLKFKCECCVFKTASQKLLDHHKANQCLNVEKKHFCRQCNLRFMWKENLANHISIFHVINSEDNNIDSPKSENVRDGDTNLRSAAEKKLPSAKRVSCPICGIFINSGSLAYHIMRHKGEKPFKCKVCEMAFTRNADLVEHNRKHTNERPFKCTMCDKSFKYHIYLRHHISLHNNERPYKCNLCSAEFIQSQQLKRHLQGHTGIKPHKCKCCGKGFSSNNGLVKHRDKYGHNELFWTPEPNTSANNSNPPPNIPSTSSDKKKNLCTICGKYISGRTCFNTHLKRHTGDRPHKCDVCGKSYVRKHALVVHRRTHFADRPFKCKQCSKSFVTQYILKCHMRQHTGERPYECNVCKKRFNRTEYLKLHMLNHTGEKPFRCGVCNQSFKCQAYLKKHMIKNGHQEEGE